MAGLQRVSALALGLLFFCTVVQLPTAEPQPEGLVPQPSIATASSLGGRPALNIGFKLPDESTRVISFAQRPLGLDFDKRAPMVVKRVQPASRAAEAGAREGWEVISVDGEDLAGRDFEYIYGVLREKTVSLEAPPPDEDRKAARKSAGDEDVNAIQLRATLVKSSPGGEEAEEPPCSTGEEAETREDLAKRVRSLEALAAKQHSKAAKLFKELGGDAVALDAGMPINGLDLQARIESLERSFEARRIVAEELQAAAKLELRSLASQNALPEHCKAPQQCECP